MWDQLRIIQCYDHHHNVATHCWLLVFLWDLLASNKRKQNITRLILTRLLSSRCGEGQIYRSKHMLYFYQSLCGTDNTSVNFFSHQTGKPSGHCGKDGTNSLLLKWITGPAHVEASLLSHDCLLSGFVCLSLFVLVPDLRVVLISLCSN